MKFRLLNFTKGRIARFTFCKMYKDFSEDLWGRVIFSDESSFCLATLSNKFYVWRPNSHQWDTRDTKKLNYHKKGQLSIAEL